METVEADLLARTNYRPVIRLPSDTQPGIVIKGLMLTSLYLRTVAMYHALEECPGDEGDKRIVNVLLETLAGYIVEYEEALEAHGISLPYDRKMTASARHFARTLGGEQDSAGG